MITFIIGTDTDVGKTYYGKKLIAEGKLLIKPIETGKNSFKDISESDSYSYSNLQSIDISKVNCYFFSEPLSPHLASEMDGINIDIKRIVNFINSKENPFVELAGGLMVPITRNFTQLDLIKSFKGAKVDLVIGNKLGCINHAILTLDILKMNKIKIRKIYINDMGKDKNYMMEDNRKIIESYFKKISVV